MLLVGQLAFAFAAVATRSASLWHPGRPAMTATPERAARLFARAESGSLEEVVAKQAAEIAELRKMVEEMQQDRQELETGADLTEMMRERQLELPTEGADLTTEMPESAVPPPQRKPQRRPSKAPVYTLEGEMPANFENQRTAIERLIARRVSARLKKHYSEADRILKRIRRMGVWIDDKKKSWSLRGNWRELQATLADEDQQSWRQDQQTRVMLEQELERRIRQLFKLFDDDGNGLIDRDEFRVTMEALALPGTPSEWDAVFTEWDQDESGTLDLKEVREALTRWHRAGTGVPLLELWGPLETDADTLVWSRRGAGNDTEQDRL